MFTISVCMIVKDEELTLERVLKCASKFADEIIVVDTGSIDNSIEIARKFTPFVYNFTWCNNFSKARNFSIDKASKDYFMWLDADDYIDDENIEKIIELKKSQDNVDFYMFKYVIGHPNPTFEFFRERLIKNDNSHYFEGAVHEAITPNGNIKYLDIKIEHRKEKVNNPTRNLDIYKEQISSGKELTPRDKYYYGRELFYNGEYLKSIKVLNDFLHSGSSYMPDIIGAYIIISENYFNLKNYTSSNDILFSSLSKTIPTAEICCKIAQNFEKLKNIESSIFWYKTSLTCPHEESGFVSPEYYDIIPYIELCKLYYPISKEQSKKYHNLAKKCNPTHPSVIYNEQFFN